MEKFEFGQNVYSEVSEWLNELIEHRDGLDELIDNVRNKLEKLDMLLDEWENEDEDA